MLGLVLVVVVIGVTLTVVLWAGTLFLQGYLYTEATTDVFWQAPAAGLVLTLFFGLWCLLDANAEGARPYDLPYDTFFRFSAEQTKGSEPVKYLWAVKRNKEELKYRRKTIGPRKYRYVREMADKSEGRPWSGTDVVAILVEEDGQKVRYDAVKAERDRYRRFVDAGGWSIIEYDDGPTGEPTASRTGLLLVNALLNLLHFGLWFACLWLLLRFQWTHALGLAVVLWVVMTLTVLPMMLMRAGAVAQESATPQRTAAGQRPEFGSSSNGAPTTTSRRPADSGAVLDLS